MLSLKEGKKIVEVARETIGTYLKEGKKSAPPPDLNKEMKEPRGVFVTLNKNGKLRGCIGRPLPTQSLIDGVMDSALSAATQDPRFPSLRLEELEDVTIEISILTQPEKIEVKDPKKLPEKVKVGIDGLIARCGGREGLLLPQVPIEHEWRSEEFLSQTCVKAGLSPDRWLEGDVELEKFSAQIFMEKEPNGEVVEKSLSS